MSRIDAAKIWSLNYRVLLSVVSCVEADITALGLDSKELFLLAEIDEHPYPAELAATMSMPKATVTVYLKRLEAAGIRAPRDRPCRFAAPSPPAHPGRASSNQRRPRAPIGRVQQAPWTPHQSTAKGTQEPARTNSLTARACPPNAKRPRRESTLTLVGEEIEEVPIPTRHPPRRTARQQLAATETLIQQRRDQYRQCSS